MAQLELDVRNTTLLTAVYAQSWPAPHTNNLPRKGFIGNHLRANSPCVTTHQPTPTNGPRAQSPRAPRRSSPHHHHHGGVGRGVSSLHHGNQELCISGRGAKGLEWSQPKGRGDGVIRSNDLPLHLGLDKGTLQWRSWSSFKQDIETVDDHKDDLSLYKITQDTFRKLTQQVSEVSEHLNSRYAVSGFQGVRRSQLAASLPSSHPSIQNHKESEGDMDRFQSSLAIQSTPFKGSQRQRPKSHLVTSKRNRLHPPPRPHSSISTSTRSKGHFDHLSPGIIGHFQGEEEGQKETPLAGGDQNLGPYDIVKDEYKFGSDSEESDDRTLATEDFRDEDDDDDVGNHSMGSMDMDSSEDEMEINERIERIRTHREKMQRKLMRLDLPPEVLTGDIDCMFPYSGSTASKKKKQEPFAEALSAPYCHMDLLELSMLDKDWRTIIRTAPDKDDAILMERMIEMEKLQYETAEWESVVSSPRRRCQSALQIRKGWNADAAVPTERAHSALGKPKQSKNCCDQCLQLVCAGDCPSKIAASYNSCVHCRQPYCNGACTDFGYHLHIRYARQEEKKKRRPKSCNTCRRSRTPNNAINTNNVILGRPRSGFATYSSSRVQSAKAKKMTVASTDGAEHVSNRMEKLRLSARKYKENSGDEDDGEVKSKKQRPRTAGSKRQIKGRDAMISGKSYQSQRRFSLTEDPVTTTAASMNPKVLRVRSAHYRTHKTRQKTRKAKKK
ncbi:uncharacterized protein LOC121407031 [Lytechinus variegatus]|uniref:uncharacterized protein LOC121407031 n=1 Tax=Lytechinus variegatus TaxID=7654 RepID=UPI001BB23716|nr:uncharacterized protein LOC121407031 [Lytechinus variegatus]